MLIEVKTKVAYIIDGKTKKKSKTFILDKHVFAEAEYDVMTILTAQHSEGIVEDYEIQSLKLSSVKEIITQYQGEHSYIVSLKDIFIDDNGNEKPIKYKVLFWANNENEAMQHIREIMSQGYDMHFAGLTDVDYEYLNTQRHEEAQTISQDS